ncbi:30S ribosomal protein S6 [Cyanobacterium stanieri LEGE 03274]|uniref:Small ribosomal subunit protein bS6 n=1 Tax=Cyanobacterium stanieri LEGE 03274 TaxID=1828756 RepID=A0ABR9V5D3_9CHRO|nr:30S ribosomal protein S6 [Cyanobacterium stanieri]MBE9223103.1 30S ribosomal protein S6 [Cyanobacterium stanieri LEGE 03274]
MTTTNTYELMFILRPDLTQQQVNQQMHKYRDLLKDLGAQKVSMEVWGKRRLAYEIQRFQEGVYILSYFTGDGSQVAPLEKNMRLSEEVIRYLTMKQDKEIEFEENELPEVEETVETPAPVVATEEVTSSEASEEEDTTSTEEEEEATPVEA